MVLGDLAGPLVLVVAALDRVVDDVDAGFAVVVLEAFAPDVLLVVLVLADAAFGFFAVVVLVLLLLVLAAVAAPARKVVVVVGLAPLGRGTVQVSREEPS